MKLFKRTIISRFLNFDDSSLVFINRYDTDDTYSTPPVCENEEKVWATCMLESPDSIKEIGSFEEALNSISTPETRVAAAITSPTEFSKMVSFSYDLGRVFYTASMAVHAVCSQVESPADYCEISVDKDVLSFFVLKPRNLFLEEDQEVGIKKILYSLSKMKILKTELVKRIDN